MSVSRFAARASAALHQVQFEVSMLRAAPPAHAETIIGRVALGRTAAVESKLGASLSRPPSQPERHFQISHWMVKPRVEVTRAAFNNCQPEDIWEPFAALLGVSGALSGPS